MEFLGFLSTCLSLVCPRQDVKRPVGFACDSVLACSLEYALTIVFNFCNYYDICFMISEQCDI